MKQEIYESGICSVKKNYIYINGLFLKLWAGHHKYFKGQLLM